MFSIRFVHFPFTSFFIIYYFKLTFQFCMNFNAQPFFMKKKIGQPFYRQLKPKFSSRESKTKYDFDWGKKNKKLFRSQF